MIHDGNSTKGKIQGDVCIVGGGVAGLVLANELVVSGRKVLLIESGNINYDQETQSLYKSNSADYPFPDTSYTRLRFLGGSSNHWQNNTSPLSEFDFQERDGISDSGWPIKYNEVSQYYPRAGEYCGVGSDEHALDYWLKKTRSSEITTNSSVIESRIAKIALSPTRFYETLGKKLSTSKGLRIVTNSNLVDIKFNPTEKRLETCIFKTINGSQFEVNANQFVMCLGGIENARMLLLFNQKYNNNIGNQGLCVGRYLMEHPTPRAAHFLDSQGLDLTLYKGKKHEGSSITGFLSLSDDTMKNNSLIGLRMPLIAQTNLTLSDGVSSSHIVRKSLEASVIPKDFGSHLWNIVSDADMVLEGIARKSFKTSLFQRGSEIGGYEIPMMMEQTPDKHNRVQLSNTKDQLGIPKIDVLYRITESDKSRLWKSLDITSRELTRLGIGRIKTLEERGIRLWNSQLGFSAHHMGTTRMSSTPDKGVVDQDLKVFGVENLYIGGSSVFPTGGSIPPTLTIVALSIRLAEHLKGSEVK